MMSRVTFWLLLIQVGEVLLVMFAYFECIALDNVCGVTVSRMSMRWKHVDDDGSMTLSQDFPRNHLKHAQPSSFPLDVSMPNMIPSHALERQFIGACSTLDVLYVELQLVAAR